MSQAYLHFLIYFIYRIFTVCVSITVLPDLILIKKSVVDCMLQETLLNPSQSNWRPVGKISPYLDNFLFDNIFNLLWQYFCYGKHFFFTNIEQTIWSQSGVSLAFPIGRSFCQELMS